MIALQKEMLARTRRIPAGWRKRGAVWTTIHARQYIALNAVLVAVLGHAQGAYSGDLQHPSGGTEQDHVRRATQRDRHARGAGAETVTHPGGTELALRLREIPLQETDALRTTTSHNGGDTQTIVTPTISAHPALLSHSRPAPLVALEAWITRHKPRSS